MEIDHLTIIAKHSLKQSNILLTFVEFLVTNPNGLNFGIVGILCSMMTISLKITAKGLLNFISDRKISGEHYLCFSCSWHFSNTTMEMKMVY